MYKSKLMLHIVNFFGLGVESSALILRNPPSAATRIPENVVSMHIPTIVRLTKRKLNKNSPAVRHARRRLF
ncbi:hypothetical protein HPULCUR_006540 [Helicostylum pulchrum]|uniref:Secreted protein n=1 Tax=Helicostylum pulchrum TaxID=562976 RepID=A0ABP9Y3J6_9FUNG